MNQNYVDAQHKRAIYQKLRQILLDEYMITDQEDDKKELECEDLPRASQIVSQEALQSVYNELTICETQLATEIGKFDFRRNE